MKRKKERKNKERKKERVDAGNRLTDRLIGSVD